MEKIVTILNEEGLHARPAGILVKAASAFESNIEINSVNAKSIMSVMSLGLTKDAEVTLKAEGTDAEEALNALSELVNNKFGH